MTIQKVMPEELHIMIDLETLGTKVNSVIWQIGGCIFMPCAEQWNISSFCFFVDPQSCIDVGMEMEWGAVQFWMKQDEEARAGFRGAMMPIQEALTLLSKANWSKMLGVWSHGLTFDLPILENAFRRCGMKAPWYYKAARDTRTLFWLSNPVWPDNPAKHSARADAIAQAGAVVNGLRSLGAATVSPAAPASTQQQQSDASTGATANVTEGTNAAE